MKNQKGFTLVEMIIVIAILAVIAGIALPLMIQNVKISRLRADVANAEVVARKVISLCVEKDSNLSYYTPGTDQTYAFDASDSDYDAGFYTEMSEGLNGQIPKVLTNNGDYFIVVIKGSGSVVITDKSDVEIYPNTATIYKAP